MNSPLKQAFIRERLERDEKYFRIYDTYTPNYKEKNITQKFWAWHDNLQTLQEADAETIEKIKKFQYNTPREKYPWPVTENQQYGWFPELLVPLDRTDRRFYHPVYSNDFIKHNLRLKQDEACLPKEKFTGVPFKVQ